VRPGDKIKTRVTVAKILDKGQVVLTTQCRVGETVVIDGEATVLAPQRG